MKLYLQLTVLLIGLVLLSSCRSTAVFDELNALRKGMSSSTVQEELKLSPKSTFDINQNGKKYTAECYWLLVFSQSSTSYSPVVGTSSFTTTTTTSSTKSIFVLLYEDNQLLYWGFLNEFSKSDDPKIAPLASRLHEEYYKYFELN